MERNVFTSEQELWLKALESGQYAQGRERLKRSCGTYAEFCCLGVACEIGLAQPDMGNHYLCDDKLNLRNGRGGFLDAVIIDGIRFGGVANMNDKGWSFAQIAAFIRSQPWQVFTNFDAPAQP